MMAFEQLERYGVALAVGLLIGLERGWQARLEREGERTAGLRTFALASMLGAVWAELSRQFADFGVVGLAIGFATFSCAFTLFRFRETGHDGTFGATTVVAAMLAFSLGALAMIGNMQVAAAMGVVAASLLALKKVLHEWLQRISWPELRSALLLLAMTFILLPILPREAVDPWGALKPFELWLMTIMIAAISFVGYVAIRVTGNTSGIMLTGLAGGLVSSTAVTLTLSRAAREHVTIRPQLIAGSLLAGITMLLRVLAIVAILQVSLLGRIGPPIVAGTAALTFVAGWQFLRNRHGADASRISPESRGLSIQNPLDIAMVLKFGLLLAVITFVSRILAKTTGAWSMYALAAASGIADVDAITLSMAQLASETVANEAAARAILIAVAVNTIAKGVLAWISGGPEVGRTMLVAGLAALGSGLATHLLWPSI